MRRSDYKTRREYLAAKHAAGIGKGHPTPRNTRGCMTRERATQMQARRSDLLLKDGAVMRALDTLLGLKRGEKAALEQLHREAGGVILAPKK